MALPQSTTIAASNRFLRPSIEGIGFLAGFHFDEFGDDLELFGLG
jgi:hypothetical protein